MCVCVCVYVCACIHTCLCKNEGVAMRMRDREVCGMGVKREKKKGKQASRPANIQTQMETFKTKAPLS